MSLKDQKLSTLSGAIKIITLRALSTAFVWTLLITASAVWNYDQAEKQAISMAMAKAKVDLAKDFAFRKWASDRGGIYLQISSKVVPSIYLSHVPKRDIQTVEGLKLTLKNPAMIINEIMNEQPKFYGMKTRITSNLYLNPNDAPDEWEKKALSIIETTRKDYYEITSVDGKQYFRMMQPMIMEKSCLKCHAWTGLKVGDLRGGTDVEIPLDQFSKIKNTYNDIALISHCAVWFFGILTIIVIAKNSKKHEQERFERENQMRIKNALLESEIAEREKVEQELSSIFDFLPDATFVVDSKHKVIAWNKAIEEMTGIPKDQIIGKDGYETTIPFYGEKRKYLIDLINLPTAEIEAKYNNVIRNGNTLYAEAFTPALYDGKGAFVWATVAPLLDNVGNRIGTIESIRDITTQKNMENDLLESKQKLVDIIDFMPDPTLIIDKDGRVIVWNREIAKLTGVPSDKILGRNNYEYSIPFCGERRPILVDLVLNPNPEFEKNYEEFMRYGDNIYGRSFVAMLQSKPAYLSSSASLLRNSAGEIVGAIECIRDRSGQRKAEERIKLLASIFDNSGEAIVITDSNNIIIEVNKAFSQFTGYSCEEAIGQNPKILKSGIEGVEFYKEMWRCLLENNYWQGEIWDKRKDNSLYPKWLTITTIRDKYNNITNYFASFSDISQRKEAERRIEHLAHNDSLTSLPNRFTLVEKFSQALEQAKRSSGSLSVMFIDLDRFKTINDSLGHQIGDMLLCEVATRLKKTLRAADIVARFGGDEFVIIQPLIRSEMESVHLAKKILNTISKPYILDNNTVYTTPSIGISIFPNDGDNVPELMKNADAAMYHAKSSGRNAYQMFTNEMHIVACKRMAIENSLRTAITNDEFILYYQPQVESITCKLVGFEALVRWQSPEHGLVSPDKFIPIAEETGLIVKIGEQVFQKACMQAALWESEGLPEVKIAVNLSARQLKQTNLAELFVEIMDTYKVNPKNIELEVTESMTMEDPKASILILNKLKNIGFDLAIDDFGTGYSSLSYLKLFPVHKLKIDKSFVNDIVTDPNDAAIASATIALGHNLGMKVIAEGVETEEQLDFLVKNGCDMIQGYLFSKPVSPAT